MPILCGKFKNDLDNIKTVEIRYAYIQIKYIYIYIYIYIYRYMNMFKAEFIKPVEKRENWV